MDSLAHSSYNSIEFDSRAKLAGGQKYVSGTGLQKSLQRTCYAPAVVQE